MKKQTPKMLVLLCWSTATKMYVRTLKRNFQTFYDIRALPRVKSLLNPSPVFLERDLGTF